MVFALKAAIELHSLVEGGGQPEATLEFVDTFFKKREAAEITEQLTVAPSSWIVESTRGRKWAEISDSD